MASYKESTEHLEFKSIASDNIPRRKWNILLGISAVFAILALVFVILYATKNTANEDKSKTGQQGGTKPSKEPPTQNPMTKAPTNKPKSTDSTKKPYMNIRLPKYIMPMHYDVAINIDLKALKYNGSSSVQFEIKKSAEYVFIHAAKMVIKSASITNKSGNMLKVEKTMMYNKNEYFVFKMASAISPGVYYAHFEYEAILTGSLKGLYKSTYKRKNGTEVVIAATQFQPTDARRAFPCFDEPALKATFSITLIHDPNYIAISNMPKISSTMDKGLTRDTFQKTVKMPTYLLALVVCDFKNKTVKTTSNVSMTFFAPPDQVDQLEYAVQVGKSILPYFEQYYNITYPLPKADMIAIPDFAAGAMENWGLITYRETALLFSEGQSSESNKQRVAVVISHELAHQWFGNLVTNEWWSDLWLNEGFASYVEYFGVNHTEPNWRMMEQIVVDDQASAFAADALVTSHPIYVEVNHPTEINEIFDSISYQKGGSILMMLDHFLTHETFLKGLNSYLNKYQYGNAKTADLWDSLSKASNGKFNVSKIMDTWTRQMGYPVVNITRNGSDFNVEQKRFLLDPKPDFTKEKYKSPFGYTWHIPFEYVTGEKNSNGTVSAPKSVWLDRKSGVIKNPPTGHWIKGNPGQYGFYRVTYDQQGWDDLISQIKSNHQIFDPKDRAGILGDAFALSRAGLLNYETTLDLFDYIDKDEDYIAWKAASSGITAIGSMFSKTSVAGRNYPKYMLKKIMRPYEKLGFRASDKGPNQHIETYLRTIILYRACGNGLSACLANATTLFNKWMEDPVKNAVAADLRSLVYFYGIMNGGEKEWNFAFARYQNTTLGSERIKLLYGMSAVQEPWMIERYLNYSLDSSKVKSQDTSYIFSYISNSNPIGRYYAWYFLKSNWDTIMAKFGGGFFAMRRIFSSVTRGFKTDYELKQFDKFVNTLKNTGTATRTITQSRESIKSNIDWLSRNEKTIANWLKKKVM